MTGTFPLRALGSRSTVAFSEVLPLAAEECKLRAGSRGLGRGWLALSSKEQAAAVAGGPLTPLPSPLPTPNQAARTPSEIPPHGEGPSPHSRWDCLEPLTRPATSPSHRLLPPFRLRPFLACVAAKLSFHSHNQGAYRPAARPRLPT